MDNLGRDLERAMWGLVALALLAGASVGAVLAYLLLQRLSR